MKKRIFLTLASLVSLLFLVGLWRLVIRFLPGMPHSSISITLPFTPEDDNLIGINPMGETDNHPKPQNPHGHPGIDFIWNRPTKIIASSAGKVTRISAHKGGPHTHPTWDVEVVTNEYALRYTELDSYGVTPNQPINQGDLIGQAGSYKGAAGEHYSIHWEFDYDTFLYDRLCPVTYFDAAAKDRLADIWTRVGDTHGGKFTEICSGDYKGRDT